MQVVSRNVIETEQSEMLSAVFTISYKSESSHDDMVDKEVVPEAAKEPLKEQVDEAPADVSSSEIDLPKASSAPDGRRKLEWDTASTAQAMTGPAGLSSIKVHLPLSGDRWVFAKTIVDKQETFPLRFSYTSRTYKKWVVTLIIIIVLMGISFVLFKIRHRSRGLKEKKK